MFATSTWVNSANKGGPVIRIEAHERFELKVQPEEAGSRLDSFLSCHLEKTSRAAVQRWIRAGNVKVDGKSRKASYLLTTGAMIEVVPVSAAPPELTPESIPLDVLYEDNDLIVINKAAGMVVHPGAGNWSGTLANALLYHFDRVSKSESIRPGIVHRLDKETSGVLLVAKNEYTHESLSKQFKSREVEKHYLALVYGCLGQSSGEIDVAIGRDLRSRTKISTRSSRPRKAITLYEVIRRLPEFTYLRVFPRTGRTHQIRVHLHHLGHPVVGDKTYGRRKVADSGKAEAIRNLARHFLHATFLRFTHPTTGRLIQFEAPLPNELERLLKTLGE